MSGCIGPCISIDRKGPNVSETVRISLPASVVQP